MITALHEEVFRSGIEGSPTTTEFDDEWIQGKSKEELSQLLFKADAIIQRRQHGS